MTLPTTMKAMVQLHSGYADSHTGPNLSDLSPYLALRDIALPVPAAGQALIKVHLAAVNPSDIHFIKGEYGQPRVHGMPAGFEAVGEVVAGETPLLGQRVSFYATGSGTWAEYAMTDLQGLVPCRPDLAETDAAGQVVNPLTAIAMFDIVKAAGADSFVLNAAGSQLCKLLIALGRDHGIKPIAVVRRAAQADMLRALGAAEVIVSSDDDALTQAQAAFDRYKPRILLDAVGDQFTADLFFAMPNHARWVNYGKLSTQAPKLTNLGQMIFRNKQIEGFWLTRWLKQTDRDRVTQAFMEIQERFVTGKWTTDVAGVVPLSQAMAELPGVLAKPDGKAFIDPRS
ncbi:zinc-binding dehydrogenase [Yoonia sediminilitoris]|uniref:NADPH:quinone reductase-like Zn-dependent oxidoreductase n=1 Tax=Yoonia sediminilitoris TaxID=1286148 RepID=A0A2T6KPL0_9RHOB|nr:zinc-binding dehydrogenase [Yoonia sediminilitoris]PUB18465.1 NADPH:quinone reductase-like Zn-dependent oxidoreductase [Yoonia sediminilitoris]RCW98633.1 NADPH:quinone reductase-like Zn-dependent oxidoreductase [Yoonia sediminilitoris]